MDSAYFADVGPDNVTEMIRALGCDPAAMLSFAADIPPASEPVGEYITDISERCRLLQHFQQKCQCYPTAAIFASFMVAPLEQLRQLLSGRSAPNFPVALMAYNSLIAYNSISVMAMRAYLQKGRSTASATTPDQLPLTGVGSDPGVDARALTPEEVVDATMSDLVKARDGHVCVFSGMTDPEVARIFQLTLAPNRDLPALRAFLEGFWGHEKALAWRQVFDTRSCTRATMNGISMSHQLRFWFDNAKFALKPLRITLDGIVVQWHWLKPAVLKPKSTIDSDKDALRQAGLSDNQTWGDCLAHRKSGVPIRTGQTFLLRKDTLGLMPDWRLLEMQWDLRRVAAICGAADVGDEYYDDDIDATTTALMNPYDLDSDDITIF